MYKSRDIEGRKGALAADRRRSPPPVTLFAAPRSGGRETETAPFVMYRGLATVGAPVAARNQARAFLSRFLGRLLPWLPLHTFPFLLLLSPLPMDTTPWF